MKTVIKNGTIVNSDKTITSDILIANGKIIGIEPNIDITKLPKDIKIIDATELFVMPGGIDVHTHFDIDVGIAKSCDDFYSGTKSAACGGTTTIIDHMGFGPKGCNLHHQLNIYKQLAQNAAIDYSFHGVFQHIDDAIIAEIPSMVDDGITSFKLYLTYNYKLNDNDVLLALSALQQAGALATVHPENDAAVSFKRQQYLNNNQTTPIYHAYSRPLECEAEAIAKMINLAQIANNAPLYIVHLSNGLGLDYIRLAKKQEQLVWAETCPQYLTLDISAYERKDATKFILSPPLRDKAECDKLWGGVIDNTIDTIATDHCSFNYQTQKHPAHNDFTKCPNGIPGVETRMPLMFSEGVMQNKITANHFVALTSTNPAKLFGLYPQKGVIAIGSDADIVLFDSKQTNTIKHSMLHDNCDYTPYEGIKVHGYPILTMLRGEIIAQNNEFVGKSGFGNFISRKKFDNKCLATN